MPARPQSRHARTRIVPHVTELSRFFVADRPRPGGTRAAAMRQNRLDLGQILTTHSLSDSCDPLRASHRDTCQISRQARNKGQARFRATALGRQTAIRAELFRASGLIRTARTQKRSGGQVTDGRQMKLLKPRLKRGGEDCDARSEHSAKPRKSWGFADGADHMPASDGRALGAVISRPLMGRRSKSWSIASLARAGPGPSAAE